VLQGRTTGIFFAQCTAIHRSPGMTSAGIERLRVIVNTFTRLRYCSPEAKWSSTTRAHPARSRRLAAVVRGARAQERGRDHHHRPLVDAGPDQSSGLIALDTAACGAENSARSGWRIGRCLRCRVRRRASRSPEAQQPAVATSPAPPDRAGGLSADRCAEAQFGDEAGSLMICISSATGSSGRCKRVPRCSRCRASGSAAPPERWGSSVPRPAAAATAKSAAAASVTGVLRERPPPSARLHQGAHFGVDARGIARRPRSRNRVRSCAPASLLPATRALPTWTQSARAARHRSGKHPARYVVAHQQRTAGRLARWPRARAPQHGQQAP